MAERSAQRVVTSALLAAAVLAVLLGLSLSALLARSILRGLQDLAKVAHRIAAGDLDARCAVTGSDEISDLASAFNDTADSLSDTMRRLTSEARREGVTSQVAEAFDMADTEAERTG